MSAHVYPAQLRSELCALPPEAFDTSLDALFLSPMGGEKRGKKSERSKVKGQETDKQSPEDKERQHDRRRIIIYCRRRLKP